MAPKTPVTHIELDVVKKDIEALQKKTEKSYDYLFGNGEIGVDEHLRNVLRMLNLRKEREDFVFKTVVGFSITTALMLLINGFIYFTKVLPILDKLAKP